MTQEIRLAFAHPSERSEATAAESQFDRISLRDHVREVDIGAFQTERGTRQRICFNIVVEVRLPNMVDDDVDKILSYDTITDAIDAALDEERLNLLETLAERVAEDILVDPRAARVFVRIEKLDRGPGALGVEIVRDRDTLISKVEDIQSVRPFVVCLGNDAILSNQLADLLDHLSEAQSPLILCVGLGDLTAPRSNHPATQRRIDLLAIEQNAWVLAGRDARCVVVNTRTELDWAIKNRQISVWAPSKIVLDTPDGPSGEVIVPGRLAAWFSGLVDAQHVLSLGAVEAGPGETVSVEAFLANPGKWRI
ncbi:MAG: dihydroneopterin aldolase [Pseudomonadota bacterium]